MPTSQAEQANLTGARTMTLPSSLPVPSWASSMVANYRRSQSLPAYVTDEMIFARCEECRGMDQANIELAIFDLIDEASEVKS